MKRYLLVIRNENGVVIVHKFFDSSEQRAYFIEGYTAALELSKYLETNNLTFGLVVKNQAESPQPGIDKNSLDPFL